MRTKEEILKQLGYTVDGCDEQKKYLFDLVISQAMDEYAKECMNIVSEIKDVFIQKFNEYVFSGRMSFNISQYSRELAEDVAEYIGRNNLYIEDNKWYFGDGELMSYSSEDLISYVINLNKKLL